MRLDRCGAARAAAAARTVSVSGRPFEPPMRFVSVDPFTVWPFDGDDDVARPEPGALAAELGSTRSTRVVVAPRLRRRHLEAEAIGSSMYSAAKMTTATRMLVSGPATITTRRFQVGWRQ